MAEAEAQTAAKEQPNGSGSNIAHALVQITTDGVPKLHCPVCNKALMSLNGYVKHLKKHEPPGGFICRYCQARFCSEDELKRHREQVHTTLTCRRCKDDNVTFNNENDYREHIRSVHDGVDRDMYICAVCGAEYKTIDPYKRHIETNCGTEKPWKCDLCPMSFVTKYNLKQHKDSHSGEKKFCCSYCGRNFLQKGRLVEHERSHTGEKPYKCDVCGKCFAHRESIVTHSSIHTGIRLVECRCCQARFSCYSNLIKHRRTRPATCGLPEFDPPKNKKRTHSRIPATLNPTSEIRVSNFNKIIKPDDKKVVARKSGEDKSPVASTSLKPTARKRTAAGPKAGPKKRGRKRKVKDSSDEYEEDNGSERSNDSEGEFIDKAVKPNSEPIKPTAKNSNTTTRLEIKTQWSDSDSDDIPDFDDAMDDDDEDEEQGNDGVFDANKLPLSAAIKKEMPETAADVSSMLNEDEFLEYSTEYLETNFNEDAGGTVNIAKVKTEDNEDGSIFNAKDELLNDLLRVGSSEAAMHDEKPVVISKQQMDLLAEPEMVFVKDELSTALPFEYQDAELQQDMLELSEINRNEMENCKVLLDDVKQQYPVLHDKRSVVVAKTAAANRELKQMPAKRRGRKAKEKIINLDENSGSSAEESMPLAKRKYRKRGETPRSPPPRRRARISNQELKRRLKNVIKEDKSWPCPHCVKIYHMYKPFEKHLLEDHNVPLADIRAQYYKQEEEVVAHGEAFKCHICGKIYLMEKRLQSHIQMHGPDGSWIHKCPCYCSLYFATREEATEHARVKHREQLYCEICKKFLNGIDSLRNHNRAKHSEKEDVIKQEKPSLPKHMQRNLVCDKCGKKFLGKTSLNDHVRSDCGRNPLYACHICGKHLTTAGILKTHLLLHKDERPYQCDTCGKTFKVKAQYKTHITLRHTDLKPFKCHLCPKAYPYRESLLTHMTVHTGIKRFGCNGCDKRFTCISNLQAHRKVNIDTCGQLPLNAKASQYMGVQKGNLLIGAKPEAGLDYIETNTLVAKEVLDRDAPLASMNLQPTDVTVPITMPLNYAPLPHNSETAVQPPPLVFIPPHLGGLSCPLILEDSHASTSSSVYN